MSTLKNVALIVLTAVLLLGAQTTTQSYVSFPIGTGACPATVGLNTICGGTSTSPPSLMLNGIASSLVGPAGPPGANGATGPAGPNWSTCTGVTLTPTGITGGVVSYTLTVVPANCK